MSTSAYGIISAAGGVLVVLVLIGLIVVAAVLLRGRGRGAVVGGLVVLIAERLVGYLIPIVSNAFDVSNLAMFTLQVAVGNLVGILGTVLIVIGAIWAYRDRTR